MLVYKVTCVADRGKFVNLQGRVCWNTRVSVLAYRGLVGAGFDCFGEQGELLVCKSKCVGVQG